MGIDEKIQFITDKVLSYYPDVDAVRFKKTALKERMYVEAAQVAMTISKRLVTGASLAEIGYNVRRKEHATVLHAIKQVNNFCETDRNFREKFNKIDLEVEQDFVKFVNIANMDSTEKVIEYLIARHGNSGDMISMTIMMLIDDYKTKNNA